LLAGPANAPAEAWRGDVLMLGAATCMALYNVWSRPIIRRSSPIAFTTLAMAVGAVATIVISVWHGGYAGVTSFGPAQWCALVYLGVFGGAVGFFLWAFALGRTTPTRVALSVTVNPVTAALVASLVLDEAIRCNLVAGLLGILLSTWRGAPSR
jgi:drug/metabolite transporter (DMT)-like permease